MTTPALGFQGAILGIGVEGTYGTAVARTVFIELNSESVGVEEARLHSGAINAIYSDVTEVKRGAVTVGGDCSFEMRYEGFETILKNAMGSVSTAEVVSFIVGASNNKLDFNIGAGQLTATIPSTTYAMGATQATAASLCKAIYDAIVAAEATGTYTVSFSNTTKKITITRSAGTFQLMWNTGTNTATSIASLIGFSTATDSTGGLTYTGGTAVVTVFDHTFTLADNLPTGLTFEVDTDITAKLVEGGKITKLDLNIDAAGFLMGTIGISGEDMTTTTVTSATLPSASLVAFPDVVVSYNAVTKSLTNFNLSLNNNLKLDRRFAGTRLIAEPQRGSRYEITGTMTAEFDATTEYTDFRAATARQIVATYTGAIIKAALTYTITITLANAILTGAVPKITDAGIVKIDLPFKAYAASSATREMQIVIRNTVSSVA